MQPFEPLHLFFQHQFIPGFNRWVFGKSLPEDARVVHELEVVHDRVAVLTGRMLHHVQARWQRVQRRHRLPHPWFNTLRPDTVVHQQRVHPQHVLPPHGAVLPHQFVSLLLIQLALIRGKARPNIRVTEEGFQLHERNHHGLLRPCPLMAEAWNDLLKVSPVVPHHVKLAGWRLDGPVQHVRQILRLHTTGHCDHAPWHRSVPLHYVSPVQPGHQPVCLRCARIAGQFLVVVGHFGHRVLRACEFALRHEGGLLRVAGCLGL